MLTTTLRLALVGLLAGVGVADAAQRQRVPPPDAASGGGGSAGVGQAVPRGEAPATVPRTEGGGSDQRRTPPTPQPDRGSSAAAAPSSTASTDATEAQAVPRGSRPRGNNPSTGRAVPRGADGRAPRARDYAWPPNFDYNFYYPRRFYPYGFGGFGLGYFYYDPYMWGPNGFFDWGYYPGQPWGLAGGGYRSVIGGLRLDVRGPRDAHVLVDGYFAGILDDFDGPFQKIDLESGPYRIQIVAPGYETMEFDIRVLPGRRTTYRGELRRQ